MTTVQQVFEKFNEEAKELGIELNAPATVEELEELETVMKQKLPQQLREFYSFCNGFETYDWLFRALPISEILKYKHELTGSWFYFAEYMMYSDNWKVTLIDDYQYLITNDNHGSEPATALTTSVVEFLERFITGGGMFGETGLYQWLEEVKSLNKNFT